MDLVDQPAGSDSGVSVEKIADFFLVAGGPDAFASQLLVIRDRPVDQESAFNFEPEQIAQVGRLEPLQLGRRLVPRRAGPVERQAVLAPGRDGLRDEFV